MCPEAHLDTERIERLAHGEIEPAAVAAAERHLAECTLCLGRLAEARRDEREIHDLLGLLDHPLPAVTAEPVRAGRGSDLPGSRRTGRGRVGWAAGILLALGAAGAAYGAPGSLLPRWIADVLGGAVNEPRPPVPPVTSGAGASAGIAVAPEGPLEIHFLAAQEHGRIELVIAPGEAEVMVRAADGSPTFSSELDRLVVDNRGTVSDFEVRLPAGGTRVVLRIGRAVVLVKEGPRVSSDIRPDASGVYLIPLAGGG